jgi:hypothetical protein
MAKISGFSEKVAKIDGFFSSGRVQIVAKMSASFKSYYMKLEHPQPG